MVWGTPDTRPGHRATSAPPGHGARPVPSAATLNVNTLLIAPIRLGDRYSGVIIADRNGEPFSLDQGELDLAQAMANIAALALDPVWSRQPAGVS